MEAKLGFKYRRNFAFFEFKGHGRKLLYVMVPGGKTKFSAVRCGTVFGIKACHSTKIRSVQYLLSVALCFIFKLFFFLFGQFWFDHDFPDFYFGIKIRQAILIQALKIMFYFGRGYVYRGDDRLLHSFLFWLFSNVLTHLFFVL